MPELETGVTILGSGDRVAESLAHALDVCSARLDQVDEAVGE